MDQPKQLKQPQRLKQIRYRKIPMAGSNTIMTLIKPNKILAKGVMIQFPVIDNNIDENQYNFTNEIKQQTEELARKTNFRAVKAIMKMYEENKKRKSQDCMEMLGLDIKKISYIPHEVSKQKQQRKSLNKLEQLEAKAKRSGNKCRNFSSRSELTKKRKASENSETIVSQQNEFSVIKPLKMEMTQYNSLNKKKIIEAVDSPRPFRMNPKKKYLYEKLAGLQNNLREEVNYIYDKRIKSYLDLLFKLQFAHNVYINLDLKNEELGNRSRRLKYYVGSGNNSAMIKGLLKRRYWWVMSQDRTECSFVWTQIKVNEIFQKQRKSGKNQCSYKYSGKDSQSDEEKQTKRSIRLDLGLSTRASQFTSSEDYNKKILNPEDESTYKKYFTKFERQKQRKYSYKIQKLQKILNPRQLQQNLVHNHLQNNFYLGNKKALFYNLKQYYELLGQNVFEYVPLTFHIKKGLKDPEYKRFVLFYNRRKNQIKKQQKKQEEDGVQHKHKTRNIWIVKPGENSNQGRGITVIDEIYELNTIIKRIGEKKPDQNINKSCGGNDSNKTIEDQADVRTYIVQMYIDRPMLYSNRKFDIRHYMLITNLFGITRAYWYAEGYIRTSSYEFNINVFEPQIHLTNDAVQKKYPEYGRYQPYNKVSYEEFQRYLDTTYPNKKYNFKKDILPKMKKMATDAAKSVYTKISPGNQMHNFEIFGLDFMIDKNFRPWLIQINTNPCLDCSCPLLDRIIPYMVEQSFKLTLDVVYPPPAHYPNTCKHFAPMINLETFKYQLIFDSQTQGQTLRNLYKKAKGNLMAEIGQIEQDEQFKDDGKEIKLDDFT